MDNNTLFYIVCIILVIGIACTYIKLRKGRGNDYVYVVRNDKEHYFTNYDSARKFGRGIRLIPKSTARARGFVLYKGDRK